MAAKPDFLYHATVKNLEETVLHPFAQSGSQAGQKLVFASDSIKIAHAYALKTEDLEICADVDGTAFAVFTTNKTYADFKDSHPSGRIHLVPSDTFSRRGDEWVSTDPVAFDPTLTIEVKSIDDVMKFGVQIFCRAPEMTPDDWLHARAAVCGENWRHEKLQPSEITPVQIRMIGLLVQQGKMRPLNVDAGIQPVNMCAFADSITRSIAKRENQPLPAPKK